MTHGDIDFYAIQVDDVFEMQYGGDRRRFAVTGLEDGERYVEARCIDSQPLLLKDIFWARDFEHGSYHQAEFVGRYETRPFLWFWTRKVFVPAPKPEPYDPKRRKCVPLF